MVFACLVLSVFATIDEYEDDASAVLIKMVSLNTCYYFKPYFVYYLSQLSRLNSLI